MMVQQRREDPPRSRVAMAFKNVAKPWTASGMKPLVVFFSLPFGFLVAGSIDMAMMSVANEVTGQPDLNIWWCVAETALSTLALALFTLQVFAIATTDTTLASNPKAQEDMVKRSIGYYFLGSLSGFSFACTITRIVLGKSVDVLDIGLVVVPLLVALLLARCWHPYESNPSKGREEGRLDVPLLDKI